MKIFAVGMNYIQHNKELTVEGSQALLHSRLV